MAERKPLPAPHTPLVWAWGGALLMGTTWLTALIALLRGCGAMFD